MNFAPGVGKFHSERRSCKFQAYFRCVPFRKKGGCCDVPNLKSNLIVVQYCLVRLVLIVFRVGFVYEHNGGFVALPPSGTNEMSD